MSLSTSLLSLHDFLRNRCVRLLFIFGSKIKKMGSYFIFPKNWVVRETACFGYEMPVWIWSCLDDPADVGILVVIILFMPLFNC